MAHLIRNPRIESEVAAALRTDEWGNETLSTRGVQPRLRNAVWDLRTSSHLVGLKTSSPVDAGFLGTMRSAVVNGIQIAEITGNAHTVERTPAIVRQLPIESVVFTFVLEGEAFRYDGTSTVLVRSGQVTVQDSDSPFLLGFSRDMHTVVATVPRYHLADVGLDDAFRTLQVLRHTGAGPEPEASRRLLDLLHGAFTSAARHNMHDFGETFVAQALQSMRQLVPGGGHPGPDHYYELAVTHITSHLGEPDLSVGSIADQLHLSQRHLGRIFAARGTTVGQEIQEARLAAALEMLTAAAPPASADIALRCGFRSPSHFSRAFRSRYGMTPTEARLLGPG